MEYYKVGCRWSDTGKPNTEILDIFLNSGVPQVVFVGVDMRLNEDERLKMRKKLLKMHAGDKIGITSGKCLVAVAKLTNDAEALDELLESGVVINDMPGIFHMKDVKKNYVIGARADVYQLSGKLPRFWVGRFCRINNEEKKQIIDDLLQEHTSKCDISK